MSNNGTTGLQQRIEQLQARADKMRAIQAMIAEDPELATELLNSLAAPPSEESPPQPRVFSPVQRQTEAPQLDKVLTFFYDREPNELASAREISEATGLTRNSVNALLYTSKHKHRFFWVQEGPKRKLWRLRNEKDGKDEGKVIELQEGEEEQTGEQDDE